MAAYDKVARQYSEVFNNINLRCFEWKWLKKTIQKLKPDSLLDIGCGNGYLLNALTPIIPNLYGIEPCAPMFRIAEERVGGKAVLRNAPAENIPFENEKFDAAVSFLSFRYMEWNKAIPEIARILKPDGIFIIIDLFAARFIFLKIPAYSVTFIKTRLQYFMNRNFHKKLVELSRNADWQKMVNENPKREFTDAKKALEKQFNIINEKILCHSINGMTIGIICKKPV